METTTKRGRPRVCVDIAKARELKSLQDKYGIRVNYLAELCGISRISVGKQLAGKVTASRKLVDSVMEISRFYENLKKEKA